MVQPGTRRHRGFEPWELSQLPNEFVLLEHAEDGAATWLRRDEAVESMAYDLVDLAKLDGRLEAHLDGLMIESAVGWEPCRRALEESPGPSEVFMAMVIATYADRTPELEEVVTLATEEPELQRALASALGWLPWERAQGFVAQLWDTAQPPLRRVALTAMAFHHRDPSALLGEALMAEDPRLAARGVQVIGELGFVPYARSIHPGLVFADEGIRFHAARSLVLLGTLDAEVSRALKALAEGAGAHASEAASLLVRRTPEAQAMAWFDALLANESTRVVAISAAAGHGAAAFVPRLIALMADETLAPFAGEALAMITGVDIESEDLDAVLDDDDDDEPNGDETEDAVEIDEEEFADEDDRPVPDPQRVEQWWSERRGAFRAGARYLAGVEVTPENLRRVLAHGRQPHRQAAAIELVVLTPGTPLYRTRRSGIDQARELLGWS